MITNVTFTRLPNPFSIITQFDRWFSFEKALAFGEMKLIATFGGEWLYSY